MALVPSGSGACFSPGVLIFLIFNGYREVYKVLLRIRTIFPSHCFPTLLLVLFSGSHHWVNGPIEDGETEAERLIVCQNKRLGSLLPVEIATVGFKEIGCPEPE